MMSGGITRCEQLRSDSGGEGHTGLGEAVLLYAVRHM